MYKKMIILLLIFISYCALGSPRTLQYFMAGPNEFWPNNRFNPQYGTQIQQTTAANNPDVFCKSHGSGYRLPSIFEFNTSYIYNGPLDTVPSHFSTYINNDINQGKRTATSGRVVSGGLINEWGNVAAYGNGWEAIWYNTTDINVNGLRRFGVDTNGSFGWGGSTYNTSWSCSDGRWHCQISQNQSLGVACLRDLIPTPLTPIVAKS